MIGLMWAYDGMKELGTPPRLYNQVLRGLAVAKGLTTEQLARTFMLANVAMGPGTIAGGNPVTPPFPAYPSGHATFGAAAFHAARLYLSSIGKATLQADGSDDLAFQFVSDEVNGKSFDPNSNVRPRHMRSFAGLHQAIYENSISRIFLGVHWRFDGTTGQNAAGMFANAISDNIGGVPLGLAIANDIASGNIKPTPATVKPQAFDVTP